MQSRIYAMNTIMRALQDDGVPNLKNSNYVPTMGQFPENNNNYNIGPSTSNMGMQPLFANSKLGGSSSILNMYGNNQTNNQAPT